MFFAKEYKNILLITIFASYELHIYVNVKYVRC